MVLSNGKKVIIGLLVGVFCLGFLGYLGYETYVKETGDDPLGEYFDDQDNKKIIKYEDETGLIITEYELKQMRKRNPATPDHELIESEKLKWEILKDEPDIDPSTISVVDEKTQNQYEYWFTVQYLKTLYKDNYYALSALGMMNPDSGRFLRKIHNIYFNDTRMFFDADVVLINETVHTQKRILVSTTNFEWENQTEKSTYEKIKMVDYMGFSDVSFLSNDTLSTELSDEIFEQAKTKVAELNEYVELGYDLTLNSTMQDKNAADNPDNLTFVVQFTKGDETRMAYVSMQIENATGTATFYNVKLYVSDPMVENWSDLQ